MPNHKLIDAMVDTYFEEHFKFSPCETSIRLPRQFIQQFENHQDFWHYMTDLYKLTMD